MGFGEDNYQQGQIDALTGKVYYELAKQTDGSDQEGYQVMSVYQAGYKAWEEFDNLPKDIREAHNIVWTGYVWNLSRLSKDDAETIVDLDQGKYMLDTSQISQYNSKV